MSNIDKQALRERYSPQPSPKCHICGTEMTVRRMSGSRITYGCTGATHDDDGCHYADGRSIADDHYEQSRVTVVDVSDPDVLALLDELEKEKGYASAYEAEKWHYHGLAESEGERADRAEKALEAAQKRVAELENDEVRKAQFRKRLAAEARIAEFESDKSRMVDALHAAVALNSAGISLNDFDECVLRLHEWGALPDYCIALYVDFIHGLVSENKLLDFGYVNGAFSLLQAEKRIAELEARNASASFPGGFSIEDARSLHTNLVNSYISKAMSSEKMNKATKEAEELARYALASLEAEPVALRWRWIDNDAQWTYAPAGKMPEFVAAGFSQANGVEIEYIYAAPPAPTVPDELTFEEIAEATASQGYEYSINECICAASWWNACRAAMLQGAENAGSRCTTQPAPALDLLSKNTESRCSNSPVIPADWVMVPRMPTTEMANAMIGVDGCSTSELLVALKLAIAAAPQQEVNGIDLASGKDASVEVVIENGKVISHG
ncbi:TPA: ead/Ea22-like family protein [Shigella dysenteriae]|uniref:ead/Ea22-like family protein n=1 Tax=Shigella dysenteriae TaxID=622 RepID=UPI001F11BF37|nr:ead/Ea22-like family protein [Shigella dysenteriae]